MHGRPLHGACSAGRPGDTAFRITFHGRSSDTEQLGGGADVSLAADRSLTAKQRSRKKRAANRVAAGVSRADRSAASRADSLRRESLLQRLGPRPSSPPLDQLPCASGDAPEGHAVSEPGDGEHPPETVGARGRPFTPPAERLPCDSIDTPEGRAVLEPGVDVRAPAAAGSRCRRLRSHREGEPTTPEESESDEAAGDAVADPSSSLAVDDAIAGVAAGADGDVIPCADEADGASLYDDLVDEGVASADGLPSPADAGTGRGDELSADVPPVDAVWLPLPAWLPDAFELSQLDYSPASDLLRALRTIGDTVIALHGGRAGSKFGALSRSDSGPRAFWVIGPARGLTRMADPPEAPLTARSAGVLGLGHGAQRARWRALGFSPEFNSAMHPDCWSLQLVEAVPAWPPCVVACVGDVICRRHAESAAGLPATTASAAPAPAPLRVPRKALHQRAPDVLLPADAGGAATAASKPAAAAATAKPSANQSGVARHGDRGAAPVPSSAAGAGGRAQGRGRGPLSRAKRSPPAREGVDRAAAGSRRHHPTARNADTDGWGGRGGWGKGHGPSPGKGKGKGKGKGPQGGGRDYGPPPVYYEGYYGPAPPRYHDAYYCQEDYYYQGDPCY